MTEHTKEPWHLCQHLKSVEDDAACKCGYRGVIFGPEHDVAMAICQPGHEPAPKGEEGTEPARYPRAVEIANMHRIVECVNALAGIPDPAAYVAAFEGMREALEAHRAWAVSLTVCDMNEIVADGGITAGMVVTQEANEQVRRLDRALTAARQARGGE